MVSLRDVSAWLFGPDSTRPSRRPTSISGKEVRPARGRATDLGGAGRARLGQASTHPSLSALITSAISGWHAQTGSPMSVSVSPRMAKSDCSVPGHATTDLSVGSAPVCCAGGTQFSRIPGACGRNSSAPDPTCRQARSGGPDREYSRPGPPADAVARPRHRWPARSWAKTTLFIPPTPRICRPYFSRHGAMLASHVPTSMGNMVFTPFSSHVGMSASIHPSQSSETMSIPYWFSRPVTLLIVRANLLGENGGCHQRPVLETDVLPHVGEIKLRARLQDVLGVAIDRCRR